MENNTFQSTASNLAEHPVPVSIRNRFVTGQCGGYTRHYGKRQEARLKKQKCCSMCPKTFQLNCTVEYHEKEERREDLFNCNSCGLKRFEENQLPHVCIPLEDQQLVMESFPFRCELCGKCYKRRNELCLHLVTSHESDGLSCKVCNRTFKVPGRLRQHELSHTKVWPCGVCNKEFKQRKYLTNHMNIHFPLSFRCGVCGLLFSQRSSLTRHVTNKHGTVATPAEIDLEKASYHTFDILRQQEAMFFLAER